MSDYYDEIYRQRGVEEAFQIAADDARKLRRIRQAGRNPVVKLTINLVGDKYEVSLAGCSRPNGSLDAKDQVSLATASGAVIAAVRMLVQFGFYFEDHLWDQQARRQMKRAQEND